MYTQYSTAISVNTTIATSNKPYNTFTTKMYQRSGLTQPNKVFKYFKDLSFIQFIKN